MFRILIAIACLCLGSGAASATILNVPGDYATLQAAIDAAVIGDEIVIAAGTYSTETVINHGGFTIRGEGEVTLLSPGNGNTTGIYGSLEADYLPVVLENLRFQGYQTGLFYEMEFSAELYGCSFAANDNGIYGCGDGPLVLRDCRFEDNHATWAGGAISSCGALLDIADCVFIGNTAAVMGGAVYSDTPFGARVFSNCLFVGNDAPTGSAVQAEYGGPVDFVGCTFVDNGSSGGAVLSVEVTNSILNVVRCIVTGSPGSAFACIGGGVLNLSCTDAWGNVEGDWTDCAAGQLGLNGNFSEDPLFCGEAGGPNGYYYLQGGSPCAPTGNACGELIGAFGVGCDVTPAAETSFSAVKSLY